MADIMMDIERLRKAWDDWNKDNQGQRFGQYAVNNNLVSSPNPHVFYEKDDHKAYGMVFQTLGL